MDTSSITVTTGSRQYEIIAGYGVLVQLPATLKRVGIQGRVRLISDENVFSLYGDRVEALLRRGGFEVASTTVPAGESSKSLRRAEELYNWLLGTGTERIDCIVALGGGVIGDLAGFVAATFLRGLALVQVPTSLLAQIDASIGGKVGINLPRGKNLVGAFYQPAAVVADTSLLSSLPGRELVAGWAEAIKMGMILDRELFETIESHVDGLLTLDPELVARVVRRCMELKARVVAEDERELGTRAILNYGHTIGHALEAAGSYRQLLHGEAVAIGMRGAATIAVEMGMLAPSEAERQQQVLRALGLPESFPNARLERVRRAMAVDKKARRGSLTWVLPTTIGSVTLRRDVPMELVDRVLRTLVSPAGRPPS